MTPTKSPSRTTSETSSSARGSFSLASPYENETPFNSMMESATLLPFPGGGTIPPCILKPGEPLRFATHCHSRGHVPSPCGQLRSATLPCQTKWAPPEGAAHP